MDINYVGNAKPFNFKISVIKYKNNLRYNARVNKDKMSYSCATQIRDKINNKNFI